MLDVLDEVSSIAPETDQRQDSENDLVDELFHGPKMAEEPSQPEKQPKLPVPELLEIDGVKIHLYHGQFVDARELVELREARIGKDRKMREKELEVLDDKAKDSLTLTYSSLFHTSSNGESTEITSMSEIATVDVKKLNFNSFQLYVEQVPSFAPEVFASKFGQILDQFEYFSSIKYVEHRNSESVAEVMDLNQKIRTGMWELLHSDALIEPEQLERLFSYLNSNDKNLFHFGNEALFDIIRFDYRNEEQLGESLDLYSRAKALLLEKLTSLDSTEVTQGRSMVDAFWADAPYSDLSEAMIAGINMVDDDVRLKNVFGSIANRLSLEEGRTTLDQAAKDGIITNEKRAQVLSALGFDQQVFVDVTSFYSEIMDDFEHYSPNQELQNYEEVLLANLDGRLLDLGFGAGRHLEKLWNDGRDVVGIDIVEEFGTRLKKRMPAAKLMLGSWHKIPLKPDSIDNAYCLGRSILHNQSPEEYSLVFKEVNKVLKDGGSFIIDLPDFNSEHYVEARDALAENAHAAGIDYYEKGSLVDSPDGVHFMARFLPTSEQFTALARLAGFKAHLIENKEFSTYEGGKNTNVYWRLEKTKEDLTKDETLRLISQTRTGGPALYIEWF